MKIQWLGHSCFKLTESTGTTVVTDPYSDVGYTMPCVTADAVTISHDHYDHNNLAAVAGSPVVFTKPGVFDIKGVRITGTASHHDAEEGKLRGKNIIFKYRMDGLDICHMGDIGHECTPQLLESILPVNVLLLDIDRPEAFLRSFDEEDVTISEDDYIELDRDDLDEQSTKVILLRRAK